MWAKSAQSALQRWIRSRVAPKRQSSLGSAMSVLSRCRPYTGSFAVAQHVEHVAETLEADVLQGHWPASPMNDLRRPILAQPVTLWLWSLRVFSDAKGFTPKFRSAALIDRPDRSRQIGADRTLGSLRKEGSNKFADVEQLFHST